MDPPLHKEIDMTNDKRQTLIEKVIKQETGWVIAGYENGVADGEFTEMPTCEQLEKEIYKYTINSKGLQIGAGFLPVKKDIRFFTTEAIMEIIKREVSKQL